jgi:catechol 2,3-dioxygenase-like lactoylglutathione lyase family enzyme
MRLDHIVFLVDDLDEAIVGWRREGYTVTPGGVHADGLTHNALICFSDGGYIELLAFRTPNAGAHRWARFRSFPGPIDYALAHDDLPTFVAEPTGQHLGYYAYSEGGRRRPDGMEIRWRTSWPPADVPGLPFLIEDLTPREWRVPGGEARSHPNRAQRIASLTLAVNQPEETAQRLAQLCGAEAEQRAEHWIIALGEAQITVRRPLPTEGDLMRRRGEGIVAFTVALEGGALRFYAA